jgi:hypothetical protein
VRSKERALQQEMQAGYDERLRAMERQMAAERARAAQQAAAASAAERKAFAAAAQAAVVAQLRAHVVEKILTLHCPVCDQAFVDFNGCFALTCSRCAAGFCAWCLQCSGTNGHAHVAGCARNTTPGRELYGTVVMFEQSQRERRAGALRAYLASQSLLLRAPLLQALARDLADLGMYAEDFQ